MPCHTASKDKPYAGGLRINTPFGATLLAQHHAGSMTPASATGHSINSRMPSIPASGPTASFSIRRCRSTAFAKISEEDIKALWAYFRTVPPIRQARTAERAEVSVQYPLRHAGLALDVLRPGILQARPGQEQCVEPRRLPGRGARPLRRLPHAAQFHGRHDREPAVARRQDRPVVCARHHREDAGDRQQMGQSPAHHLPEERGREQLDRAWSDAGGRARQPVVPDGRRSQRHGHISAGRCRTTRTIKSTDRVATLAPDVLARAAKLYVELCASCHQPDGQGVPGSIPPIARNPAVASGPAVQYSGGRAGRHSGARHHDGNARIWRHA